MITESEQPVWYPYVRYDDDFNPYLTQDAPQAVVDAFNDHLRTIDKKSQDGELIDK